MGRILPILTAFRSVLILSILLIPIPVFAQTDSTVRIRVSLLTVGTGDEIYASFGHTGIRVTDSARGTDEVYNWGTFDFSQPNFELKYMRGKLLYYAAVNNFQDFYAAYVHEKRGVEEQEILMTAENKRSLLRFLTNAIAQENRYYKYDFLYDNCATRQRNIFPEIFGPSFHWGSALPPTNRLTFRDEINRYLHGLPWERFGINLLLGAKIDQRMSNDDAMFLPDYLRNALTGATVNGRRIATAPVRLLPAAPSAPTPANGPLILSLCWAALIIIVTAIPGIKPIGHIAGTALLITTGLLGCLMIFMWVGTDHNACRPNYNLLWCLPTNIIIPFVKRQKRSRYAILALLLLGCAVLLHVTGVQRLPMQECWPLILALGAVFGMIYRASKAPAHDESHTGHHHHHH